MFGDAFAEAIFRGSAFVLPTAANLDLETAVLAARCAAGLASDLAVFLVAITLPSFESIRNSRNEVARRGRNSVRCASAAMS